MVSKIIVGALIVGYLGYIVFERFYQKTLRKSFTHVIHVNGTRGKSTITRLIDAGVRNCGFRVFSKTTGTIPTIINTANEQVVIKRLGLANIREQLKMMRLAQKEKAEVLVIECMAVSPELQYISQDKMLEADIAVITNVRLDHLQEMGSSLPEIASSLANVIPKAKHLVLGDAQFLNIFQEKAKKYHTEVHVAEDFQKEDSLNTFFENINIALEVAKVLGLDLDKFYEGMKNYYPDPGAFEIIETPGTVFLNGLSINDPDSIMLVYHQLLQKYPKEDMTILLNSRNDRPSRVLQHIELLKKLSDHKIILTGTNTHFIKRKLGKDYVARVEILRSVEDLKKEKVIFAIGNIASQGMEILHFFKDAQEVQS
ncbi:MAG TPA: poly-gamma-glutamate synthase PgsB [Bacilli bacterium]|nr:poly-gamma-glutamate synthase PgsB [Bacilli bacterium]